MVELGQLGIGGGVGHLCACTIGDGVRSALGGGAGASGVVFVLHWLWIGDPVRSDDCDGGDQYLVGAESDSVHVLVLSHQFLSSAHGDLPARVAGLDVVEFVYLLGADFVGGKRASSNLGLTFAATGRQLDMDFGGDGFDGRRGGLGSFSLGFSGGIGQLSQRQ